MLPGEFFLWFRNKWDGESGKNNLLLVSSPRGQVLPLKPMYSDQGTFHQLNQFPSSNKIRLCRATQEAVCATLEMLPTDSK